MGNKLNPLDVSYRQAGGRVPQGMAWQEAQRGPAMDEARLRTLGMLNMLGAGLPTASELGTSVLYDSGRMDAMTGGPTRGEFRDTQQQKVANVALGLLGAIQPLWHGSPHKFSRFDLSRIGTGEGAQAYGHGAYLAESPGTAQSYKDNLSMFKQGIVEGGGVKVELPQWIVSDIQRDGISAVIPKWEKRLLDLEQELKTSVQPWITEQNIARFKQELDAMRKIEKAGKVNAELPGHLYESRLRWPDAAREAADPLGPAHFLDWDKPLSQQAPEVQAAIFKDIEGAISLTKESLNNASARRAPVAQAELDRLIREKSRLSSLAGSDYYNQLSLGEAKGQPTGAKYLQELGVPGLRYLDAGSRGTGQGTHNYVVFDDALIEILKRNGEPIGPGNALGQMP